MPGAVQAHVVVDVSGQRLLIDLRAVERIVRMVEIAPSPGASLPTIGWINVAGAAVRVASGHHLVGRPPPPLDADARLVLLRVHDRRYAVLVDQVLGVQDVPVPTPEAVPTAEGLAVVLDVNRWSTHVDGQAVIAPRSP